MMVESYSDTTPYTLDINTWKLNDRGPNTPESRFGADYIVDVSIDLPNYSAGRGVLVQAKRTDHTEVPDLNDVRDQCESMLEHSPDSFVQLFSSRTYKHYPANQLKSTQGTAPEYESDELSYNDAYFSDSTLQFYKKFYNGFIGDSWIHQNLRYLTNPRRSNVTRRPVQTDGGEQEIEDKGGSKALVISISDPSVSPDLPFDPSEDTVEEFAPSDQTGFEEFE
jgi:hypothetical protein